MILINPYSFYAWWAGVTFQSWDASSPFLNSWVLSNGNKTATLGNTSAPQLVRAPNPVKGVSSGKIRAVEYKIESIGPMTGTKVYSIGFLQDRTASVLSDIGYQFYAGAAFLNIGASSMQSGSMVNTAVSVLSSGDVIGFTFDMSATNIVMRVYRNGALIGGPYTLASVFNNANVNNGLTAAASNVGGVGTNAVSVTLRTKITEMEYWSSYGANDGFWA